MNKPRLLLAAACAVLLHAGPARAAYPERPVRIIVPVAPGGTLDTVARLAAEYMRVHLGGTFLVENKPGGNTEIGAAFAAAAAPDGYTLFVNSDSLVTSAVVSKTGKIDPVKSFAPVSLLISSPGVLVVRPGLGVKSVKEFIEAAHAKPLSVASTGTGTASQFTGMLFRQRMSLEWTDVPYSGSGPAVNDMLGGHVDAIWAMAAPLLPHIRSGRMTALAVTSRQRSDQLPGIPTVDESTAPGFVVENWTGLFAPAGTPPAVIDTLSDAMAKMMKDPKQAKLITEMGFEPIGSKPAVLADEIRQSLPKWQEVAARSGLVKPAP
ncbi:Tripartite tricarboxylate transporter family receptor [Pigmentiphaga humi]|uniref:Tripartite tricarboxylate transporter family receptor n=1 Tax=Pigmentiphaga humi TaxID=2478468 RepID=A0A3P4B3T6_9BURK|nr:tripartite tricarboxylate transporter substrate binding protein [Pigmentiphaga humi]VCU70186.1 Tripartite tricarboxylate transporter family receptor [Pigmentiphaga humi]